MNTDTKILLVRVFGLPPRIEELPCRKQVRSDDATTYWEDTLESDPRDSVMKM
jgi:hypothetical protein